ncbi:MAG: type III PLP-dependent enzyme [Fibrobacterota bacterium]
MRERLPAAYIKELLKKNETPFMAVNTEAAVSRYRAFRKALPGVEVFYSVKANPDPEIIKALLKEGASFDAASAGEIGMLSELCVPSERMIYANTVKPVSHIKEARKAGVQIMTFDNEQELRKIADNYPGASVMLRIKVTNLGSVIELSRKFGAEPERSLALLKTAAEFGLCPFGVSFHVGSQCTDIRTYSTALEISSEIFKEAEAEEIKLEMLDIGGGFPIRHFDNDTHPTLRGLSDLIRKELKRLFKPGIRIIAEPGRFIAGPSCTLAAGVIGKTVRNDMNYYYLDDGIYGDFSGVVFDQCKYEYRSFKRGQKYSSVLAGPSCDSFDTVAVGVMLPELDVGDVVYVRNIGAYSCATAVDGFNGFRPARKVYV